MKKINKYPPHFYHIDAAVNKAVQSHFEKTLFEDRENADMLPHNERLGEQQLIYMIVSGDVAGVDAYINSMNQSGADMIVGSVSDSPVRQAKYIFVSAITLYTRAAMQGGLPEEIAYNISDSYIRVADAINDPDEINMLALHALRRFTQEVCDCTYRNCSPAVRICCTYIQAHLHDAISLADLAEVCHRSPNYISDLFAKELGERPISYIRLQKLKTACLLLETSDMPIADIASLLSFPSHSSFAVFFAKKYHISPHQYRLHNRK